MIAFVRPRISKLLLLCTLGVLTACAALIPHDYLITQQQLTAKLQGSFPFKRDLGNGFFNVAVDMPSLGFDTEHNRVVIHSGFSAYSILSGPLQGTLTMSSSLRFDAEQRAIFLQDPQFENLTIMQDASYAEMLRPAMNMILIEYLRTHPLYRFQADELRFAGTAIDITGLEVVTDGIRVKLAPRKNHP
jgi:hypothetical protein